MLNPAYMVGQLERGENGTLHWQFAIQWSHSRSFAAIKKDLPLAHFERSVMGGSRPVLPERRTLGTPGHGNTVTGLPAGSARLRPRTGTRGILSPRRGALRKIPAKIQIKHLGNLERIHRQNLKFIDQTDVRGVWIWGKPGVGKSHFARQVLRLRYYLSSTISGGMATRARRSSSWRTSTRKRSSFCTTT